MTRLCVFIGEGDSERYFLPSLLQHQMGFSPLTDKNAHFFQKNNLDPNWFFPFPPLISSPEGGKDRLKRPSTYKQVDAFIRNNAYLFTEPLEIFYRVAVDHVYTDKQGQAKKKQAIEKAIKNSSVSYCGYRVEIVENEIENWYFAGLNRNFPYLINPGSQACKDLLKKDPECISDPKTNLRLIISPEIHGTIKLAEVMGQYFDMVNARSRSQSFDNFYKNLHNDGLI